VVPWALLVCACAIMPRAKGVKNYKNDILIPIITEILPNGEYGWSAVALAYQEQAREDEPRNTDDLKRHWVKNLCQNMKKPTGRPGENSDRTHRCIAIERKIMEKTHAGMMGIEESEDEDRDSGAVVENEGELGVVNTLRRSPPRVSKTRANGFIRSQLVSSRVPTAKVVDEDDDGRVIAEWESRREEEEFQDYSDRIDNPQRTSIAGTIVKMIERIDSSSNSTMTANMNMMMMRQMEEMNRGMARRHKEERRERKREKKHRQKRRDKRNDNRQAMINLDDHGGKGGGSLSESSSSESSSSSSDDSSQDSGYGKGEWRGQTNIGGGEKS